MWTHLVQGILWYHVDALYKAVYVHENDGHGPKGGDGENADERVNPNGRTSDLELEKEIVQVMFIQFSLRLNMHMSIPETYISEIKVAICPQYNGEDREHRLQDCVLEGTQLQPEQHTPE